MNSGEAETNTNSRIGRMNREVFSADPVDEDAIKINDVQKRKGA